ncbi:MAG TPA: choice-of-anchor D domain-containing protein [Acidobacteriaceae bacterium]|jgi:kumamolisin
MAETTATTPKGYKRLAGSERHPSKGAEYLGPADPNEHFTATVILRRRPDGAPVPDFDYFAKTPFAERQREPEESFAAQYGAHPEELRRVEEFARTHGLRVTEASAARRSVMVSGTVEQMSRAFGVTLGRYRHTIVRGRRGHPETETYRGRDGFIHVPNELSEIITGIFGLDNRTITKHNAADPPGTTPLPTTEITKLYDFPTNAAAGQTIGIVSTRGYLASDISLTFAGSPPQLTDVSIDGATNGGFADGETTQDICIAALAAPGAAVAVYFQPGDEMGWVNLFFRVAHPGLGDPRCSVVSSSFYICDGDDPDTLTNEGVSAGLLSTVSDAFMDAALQGVTICIASGDTGASSKVGGNPGAWSKPFGPDHKAHVQFPGSSPWVLAVGGTTIGNVSGLNFDEYVWNDPSSADPRQWGTTGGGVSAFFSKPSYQSAAGIPVSLYNGKAGRGVPDVAGNASANAAYSGIFEGGSASSGNGTSASSPLWAGLIAVLNGALGLNVGFVNPVIYALGSGVFRDIVPGAGPANNDNAGVTGYPAGVGWDACTGWGSPRGKALLLGLRRFFGPVIEVNLEDNLDFAVVCRGPKYRTLHVYNVGTVDLMVLSITRIAGSSDFTVLGLPSTPLAIEPGSQIDFTIEYNPTVRGVNESAIFQIVSDDPINTKLDVLARGFGGTGALETIMAGHGNFGDCCVGSFREEPLTLNNNGPCNLSILDVTSSSPEFTLPGVNAYPLVVASGNSITLPVRFQPTSFGAKAGTITVFSDAPGGSKTVRVHGEAPAGKLAVTGSTRFGGVKACCRAERTIQICNVGDCKLHISSVAFKHQNPHWKLINNPFPATLHPGSSLNVVIRYKATQRIARVEELIIRSDDPTDPVKVLEVLAYTIWDDCGCKKPCDDPCKKKCDPCGEHGEVDDEEEIDVEVAVR